MFSNTTLFLCFQSDQTAKVNTVFHGQPFTLINELHTQLVSSHLRISRLKVDFKSAGTPIFLQKATAKGQSLNKWIIVSASELHRRHMTSHSIPLDAITSLTGTLLWWHSQRKWQILGSESIFQIQLPLKPSLHSSFYTWWQIKRNGIPQPFTSLSHLFNSDFLLCLAERSLN